MLRIVSKLKKDSLSNLKNSLLEKSMQDRTTEISENVITEHGNVHSNKEMHVCAKDI